MLAPNLNLANQRGFGLAGGSKMPFDTVVSPTFRFSQICCVEQRAAVGSVFSPCQLQFRQSVSLYYVAIGLVPTCAFVCEDQMAVSIAFNSDSLLLCRIGIFSNNGDPQAKA